MFSIQKYSYAHRPSMLAELTDKMCIFLNFNIYAHVCDMCVHVFPAEIEPFPNYFLTTPRYL